MVDLARQQITPVNDAIFGTCFARIGIVPTSKCHDDDSPPFLSSPPSPVYFIIFLLFFPPILFDSTRSTVNWIEFRVTPELLCKCGRLLDPMNEFPASRPRLIGRRRERREKERWEMIKRIEEEGVKRMDIEAKTEERRWIEVAQFGWLNWPRVYVEERVTELWQRPWFMRVNASPREAALNSSIHPFKRPFFSGKWTSLSR